MISFGSQFQAIADVCSVVSTTTFSWFDATTTAVPDPFRNLPAGEQRSYLVAALAERIYQDAFSPGCPRPTPPPGDQLLPGRDRHFASTLAAANQSTGAWETGWRVFELRADTVGVQSGGLSLWVHPRDLQPTPGDGLNHEPGHLVSVKMPAGSHDLSPGYYCSFSDTSGTALVESQQIVRLYWALTPAGAAPAVHAITEHLNQAGIPYRFKILAAPAHYYRADTAVLYLGIEDLARAADPLQKVMIGLWPYLRDQVPMFTLPVARGISLAEEPSEPSRQSFGQHRSAVVAEGLVRASEDGATNPRGRAGHIAAAWTAAGLSVDAPFVAASSSAGRYHAFRATLAQGPQTRLDPAVPQRKILNSKPDERKPQVREANPRLLADHVGARLVENALWHDERCTWLSVVATTDENGQPTLAHGVVGPDLYDGVAGIALFLALLGSITGSRPMQRTALAAAQQALATDNNPLRGPGLYIGRGGVALAAATTAVLTGDQALLHQANQAHLEAQPADTGPDLLLGAAGAVVASLVLAELCGDSTLVSHAIHQGEGLLRSATISETGWSWALPSSGSGPHLTGLSHGASGVAAALMELGAATGEERFLAAARSAFAYERGWFDPTRRNWPDLRDITSPTATPSVFLSQWCHGAPGIALTRLRAIDLLGDSQFEQEAEAALETTLTTTREALRTKSLSYSLCHGIAGNLAVLDEGRAMLSSENEHKLRSLDDEFTVAATERIGDGLPWPCGVPVPDLEVPGLLVGTAGIGYHFLRRSAPMPVPSLLLVQPFRFVQQIHALAAHRRTATQTGVNHA